MNFKSVTVVFLTWISCLSFTPLLAEPKGTFSHGKLSVSIQQHGNDATVSLSGVPIKNPTIFALSAPNRLVIDIPNGSPKGSSTFPVKGDSLISKVRFGAQQNKTRVVLDLSSKEMPDHSASNKNERLVVLLKQKGTNLKAAISPTPVPTFTQHTTLRATPIPTATTAPEPSQTPLPNKTAPPIRESTPTPLPPTPLPTSTKGAAGSVIGTTDPAGKLDKLPGEAKSPGIEGIHFLYAPPPHNRVCEIILGKSHNFTISQKDDVTYIVEFEELSGFRTELAQAFFPPSDFTGFTFAKAEQGAKGVRVIIGVDQGVRLQAIRKESSIWLVAEEG